MDNSVPFRRPSVTVPARLKLPEKALGANDSALVKSSDLNLLAYIDSMVYPLALQVCFVGMMFGNNIDVAKEIQGAGESSLNFQILLKLVFMGMGLMLAIWGWWFRPKVRQLLVTVPGLLLLTLAGWHLATTPLALMPNKAMIGFVNFVAALMVSLNLLIEFGLKRTVLLSIAGLALFSLGSVALYAVSPELATFREVMNDVVTIERFGGLSHPNTLGRYAVLTMLLALIAIQAGYLNWKWMLPLGLLSTGVLIASISRTPVIAGLAATVVVLMPLLRYAESYLLIALCSLGLLMGYVVIESSIGFDFVLDRLVEKTTKTGSSEEITTGTGRTDIWEYSIRKTSERPIYGWGIGSTALVMEDKSGHSHNLLLHPALALGLPGVALVIIILILNLIASVQWKHPLIRGMFVFIIVLGLVESPLLGSFPDGVCMLWFVITVAPIVLLWDQQSKAALGEVS